MFRLVRVIQRALLVIRELTDRLVEAEGRARRAKSAELEARYELDEARRHRAAATARADNWAKAHPFRMRAGKLVGRQPAAWRDLSHDIRFHQKGVQATKDIVAKQAFEVTARQGKVGAIKDRVATARGRLQTAASGLGQLGPDCLPPLLAVLSPEQRIELEPALAEFDLPTVPVAPRLDEQLVYRPPLPRLVR